MVKCPECGADNPDEAVYCQECYAKLTPPDTKVWREEVVPQKKGEKADGGMMAETKATTTEGTGTAVSKEEATTALKEVKAFLKKAKDEGKDITEAKKTFMEAKPAYDRGDFAKVVEIADKVKSMLA